MARVHPSAEVLSRAEIATLAYDKALNAKDILWIEIGIMK